MSATAHPWGRPWLCHPNLSWSLGVPALQPVQPVNPTGALAAPWGPLVLPASFQNPVDVSTHPWGGLGSAPHQPRYLSWYLGGFWVHPGPLGGCGVVWGCHLGVLLTAVLREGRRRVGGGPGLHPEAPVVGAARAAPAPLGVGVLPPAAGVRGDTLGRAVGAGEQPEGTGVVVVLVWGWRVGGGQETVPPLTLAWPAVPAWGGSDLPRAPALCPWGGHGRGGPARLGGSPLPPKGPFAAAVELRLGGALGTLVAAEAPRGLAGGRGMGAGP